MVQPQRNTYYNTTTTTATSNLQQQYDPNQFDAYYSVYDEDADLYRDVGESSCRSKHQAAPSRLFTFKTTSFLTIFPDYGQQYNQNSQRPAVQPTYRPQTVPTTTTTTTTTTQAPREVYVPQKQYNKPVATYEYDDGLGQVTQIE